MGSTVEVWLLWDQQLRFACYGSAVDVWLLWDQQLRFGCYRISS